MAALFDIVSVQKLDGVRATAALYEMRSRSAVRLSLFLLAWLSWKSAPRRAAERSEEPARLIVECSRWLLASLASANEAEPAVRSFLPRKLIW